MDKETAGMSRSKINTATRIGDDMTTVLYCLVAYTAGLLIGILVGLWLTGAFSDDDHDPYR